MKICKHCRFASRIHDVAGKVKCRKKKTIMGESGLCEEWKKKK